MKEGQKLAIGLDMKIDLTKIKSTDIQLDMSTPMD